MKEEAYVGSEADIASEFGVSLPTLRQAARMLEYEELLTIKPGKGGGYFTRRPTIETAMKSASQFLSSKVLISNATFMDVADPMVIQVLEAAVKCKDEDLIKKLRLFAQGGQGEGLLLRGLQPSVTVMRIEQHESAKKERKKNGQPGGRPCRGGRLGRGAGGCAAAALART